MRLRCTILVPLLAAAAATPLPGQSRDLHCRSAVDTIFRDSVARANIHALQGVLMVPGVMMANRELWCAGSRTALPFRRRTIGVTFAAGVAGGTGDGAGSYAGRGVTVEVLRGSLNLEGRIDRFGARRQLEMWSARAGYLFHPAPSLSGGVLVGYRQTGTAGGARDHPALEVGVPVMAVLCRGGGCWMRWEPVYLFSARGLDVSPRLQVGVPMGRLPLTAGMLLEARGLSRDDPVLASLTLGVAR